MIVKRSILFIGTLLTVLAVSNIVVVPSAHATVHPDCKTSVLGMPQWFEYLEVGPDGNDPCAIKPFPGDDAFNWGKALPRVGMAVIEILLRVIALIAVGFTVYGGFRYILSQGEPEATKTAKNTIINASIGLVIAMFASVLVGFIGGVLW